MFLILILILLLAGIAFLLWWRGKEEREWLMELAYLSRHEGRETPAAHGADAPKQQPARPNVQDQRSQQQIKRHYQKIQDDLRRKIEQLGPKPNKKKPRRRKSTTKKSCPSSKTKPPTPPPPLGFKPANPIPNSLCRPTGRRPPQKRQTRSQSGRTSPPQRQRPICHIPRPSYR